MTSHRHDPWLLVGGFTRGRARARRTMRFDAADGTLAAPGPLADALTTCSLARPGTDAQWLLVTDHAKKIADVPRGFVGAYRIDNAYG